MKKLQAVFAALLLFSGAAFSQQHTYDFLRLDVSPRAGSLAGSYVAADDDPNVIFYNPAGIRATDKMPVSFSFTKHLTDINMSGLAIARNFQGIGTFSLGVQYINYGSFSYADESGLRDGRTFGAGEAAFLVGYSGLIADNFYYGVNAKYIYSAIENYSSSAMAADIGLQYAMPEQLMVIGFSALNLGGQIDAYSGTKEDLPVDVRLGITKKLEHMPLRLSVSFNRINEDADNFGNRFKHFTLGGEFTLSKVLRLRIGYDNDKRKDLKIGSTAGLGGFSLGLGALIDRYNFDYAFSSLGSIGAIHRIGVSTSF